MRLIFAIKFSRVLIFLEPVLKRFKLLRLWKIATYLTRRKGEMFTQSVYGPYLESNSNDHQYYLCATGRSGFKLHDILRRKNKSDFVFIDVGANIGLYSLLADQNPRCQQVYAIDPNPVVFDQLKKNADYNQADKIKAYNIGIADKNGIKAFFYKDWHRGLGNFLGKGDFEVQVPVRNYSFFDELHDNHRGQSFFLKIDVEGYEPEVVQQVLDSHLTDNIDEVFIEISPKWNSSEQIEFIFSAMKQIGLKEVWRSSNLEQFDIHFKRPEIYAMVDQERLRLGSWDRPGNDSPKYTICISNYNMADTLERAVSSVVEQLDDQYEVLVIDDTSTDESVKVLKMLAAKYSRFRFIALPKDRQRLLGETRNISVRAARGEYVLLHIDADDVWEPYLMDFVNLFHRIETIKEQDFYLVGQQTGIAKRSFLLGHGPYENIYRGEDRNLMFRVAEKDAVVYMDYQVFRTRLTRPPTKQFFKTVGDVWSHIMYDMRIKEPRGKYIGDALWGPFGGSQFGKKLALLRALIVIPAYIASRSKSKFNFDISWEEFMAHREKNRGTYSELMINSGGDPDISFLSPKAQEIFSYKVESVGFRNS